MSQSRSESERWLAILRATLDATTDGWNSLKALVPRPPDEKKA